MDTIYRPADTDNDILRKILVQYGGFPRPGDFDNSLYRKILTQLGGTFRPGDGTSELLRKIATRLGAGPLPGDTTNKLLYRIDQSLASEPRPGDYDNILLRKWLSPNALVPTPGTTIVITPKVNPPHTQAEVTVNIAGGDNLVGFWLGFWVLQYSDPSGNKTTNFQLVDTKFVTGMPFSDTFTIPIPSVNPSTVCVAIVKGPTQASVSSTPLKTKGAYKQCFSYTSDFIVVNFNNSPAAPVATAATALAETSFSANWNASATATSYRLDVATDIGFTSFVAGFNNLNVGNVLTQSVTGLTGGTTYYFRVRAVNGFGTSPSSNIITSLTVPAAVVATASSSVTDVSFDANWNAATGAASYRLDVSTANDFSSFVSGYNDLNVGNVTTESVTGLTGGTTYYLRVRAVNASGTSANSNTITTLTVPAATTTTAATNVGADNFSANWNSATSATSYRLDVATDSGFTSFVTGYNDLNVGNVVTAAVTGLTPGTQYFYRVRAVNASGTSANSNTTSVTPDYDSDVSDWITRVQGQGSDTSTSTRLAVNSFVVTVKGFSGLWTKLKRVGVYAGNDILALNAPLKNVWGNTTDGLGTFVGSGYAESTGLTGTAGSQKGITTGVDLSAVASIDDVHISVYSRTSGNEAQAVSDTVVSGNGSRDFGILVRYASDTTYFACCSNAQYTTGADTSGQGFYIGTRTASNSQKLYRNGSLLGTNTTPAGTFPNFGVVFHCQSASGVHGAGSARALAFYSLGLGLDATDSSNLYSAVQALQTALSRQV